MRWSPVLLATLGSGCVIANDHETAVMVLMWDLGDVSAALVGPDPMGNELRWMCGSEVQLDGAEWSVDVRDCQHKLYPDMYSDRAGMARSVDEMRWEGLSEPWTITDARREGWVSFEDYRGRINVAIDGATGTWDPVEDGTDGTLSLEISYPELPGGPYLARGTAAPTVVAWEVWPAEHPDDVCAGETTLIQAPFSRDVRYVVAPCSL
jgi:hypothetical protein